MRRSILLLAIMTCMSCGPANVVTEFQRDSVFVHVRDTFILRDTVVEVRLPDESGANVLPDSDTSYLRTSLAESEAYIENGQLHHSLRNRSDALLPVKVQYIDRARTETRNEIGWRTIVETVEVEKELSRWQNFLLSLGWAVLIAGAAWLAWKLSKIVKL